MSSQVGTTSGSLFQSNLTADGVLYADTNKLIASTTAGTATQVLTSNGPGVAPTFQAVSPSASSVTSIAGDTGSATPSAGVITFDANPSAGASVRFSGSGSTVTLNVTDSLDNTFIGSTAGNTTLTGLSNVGVGWGALNDLTTASSSVAVGYAALAVSTSGPFNVAVGRNALVSLLTGRNCIAIGGSAGGNYTGAEGSNISISNTGTTGESHVIRIGTQGAADGQQNQCFIAGITGVTVSNPTITTINSSTGQLGNIASANSGVLTTNSSGVPSIDTTNFAVLTTGVQMKGNNTNTAPPAGFIGQQITASATSVATTNGAGKSIASITITPGIWDVTGAVNATPTGGAAVMSNQAAGIGATLDTVTGSPGINYIQNSPSATSSTMGTVAPLQRIVVSSNTTYYINVFQLYSSTTCPTNGYITATRVG